jgi:hypothetical protein
VVAAVKNTVANKYDLAAYQLVQTNDTYAPIPNTLNNVVAQEQALVTRLSANPSSITPADMRLAQSLRSQEATLIAQAGTLGAKIAVNNGSLVLTAK